MKNLFTNLEIIIIGPVRSETEKVLHSYDKLFPESKKTFVTWENEKKIKNLSNFERLNMKDVGPINEFGIKTINIKRQLALSTAYIPKSKWVLRGRSDIIPNRILLNELNLRENTNSINKFIVDGYIKTNTPFFLSDFFIFGLSEEVLKFYRNADNAVNKLLNNRETIETLKNLSSDWEIKKIYKEIFSPELLIYFFGTYSENIKDLNAIKEHYNNWEKIKIHFKTIEIENFKYPLHLKPNSVRNIILRIRYKISKYKYITNCINKIYTIRKQYD